MTLVYLFTTSDAVRSFDIPHPPSTIVATVNRGELEKLPEMRPFQDRLLDAICVGRTVLITESEAPDTWPQIKLTRREYQVLQMLGAGLTVNEISFYMHLDTRTIRGYTTDLRAKYKVRTNEQLMAFTTALGVYKPDLSKLWD